MSRPADTPSFGRRFVIALLLGLPGIAALSAYIYISTPEATVPAGLTRPLLAIVSAVNPLLLLGVACILGAYAAPRVGLRSYVIQGRTSDEGVWGHLRNQAGFAFVTGVVGGVSIIVLDVLLMGFVAQDLPQSVIGAGRQTVLTVLAYAPVRFLYGGITEELMLRFGLMSVLVFVGWRVTGRPEDGPRAAVVWTAIVLAAVLFGAGHLPALAQTVELTPALVARTVLLNAIAGVLFGWLYWRRSLESAILAHASFHVPLLGLSLVQVGVL
jgi:membrane protease YdiL (CAAX protease family)